MYNLWFVLLVGGLCLAFCAFGEANLKRTNRRQLTGDRPCNNSCLKGCKYTRKRGKVVCRSLNCTCIPDGIQRNVTSLVFTQNNLHTVKEGPLQKLTELAELNLSSNKIRVFEPNAFEGLVKLRLLDLSNNPHVKFTEWLFKPLTNLRELHLSRTMRILKFVPQWLDTHKKLINLSYAVNQLHRIPIFTSVRGRIRTPNLKELHLEDNNIRQIYSRELIELSDLERLFLCRNFIGFIEKYAFNALKKLRYLNLDGNSLVQLEHQSFLSSSVEFLNIANTRLFEQQYSSYNPLNINNSILSLDLSGTNLNNHLLNGFVEYYETLRSLNVNQNNLEILTSETFQKLPNLEELRAANNTLTQVSDSSLPPKLWTQLKTLDLSGNPFRCDCKLVEFCQWIKAKNFSYSGKLLNTMQCVTYEDDKRKTFPVLTVENRMKMECLVEEKDWILRTSTAAVFVVSLLSTLASTLHRFRWNIRYWYFSHKIKTRRFKQVQDKKHYTYDAFISYSETDSRWVIRQLLPRLECEYQLRLCIHHRDWLAGRDIAENIVHSIEQSRKTVLIVSNAFAVSQWCHFEMTMAQSRVFQDDRDNLILVMLEEIFDCNMSPRLRMLTERQTYVQWVDHGLGQQLFWVKLGQALAKPAPRVTDALPPLNVFVA